MLPSFSSFFFLSLLSADARVDCTHRESHAIKKQETNKEEEDDKGVVGQNEKKKTYF